jgi:deoxyadenosine/deoxycytidine kinase
MNITINGLMVTKKDNLLIIDCDKNKFAENEEQFGEIISKVDGTLFGLF